MKCAIYVLSVLLTLTLCTVVYLVSTRCDTLEDLTIESNGSIGTTSRVISTSSSPPPSTLSPPPFLVHTTSPPTVLSLTQPPSPSPHPLPPPPSTPQLPKPPRPIVPFSILEMLVDASCAPYGTFVCYDSEAHGWNPDLNIAVVGGCDAARLTDPESTDPESTVCNEPNNHRVWHVNCESGYDCTDCGVDVVLQSGERQKVPSTSCEPQPQHQCTSRLHNFDCCTAYCDSHGKTGTNCPECNQVDGEEDEDEYFEGI